MVVNCFTKANSWKAGYKYFTVLNLHNTHTNISSAKQNQSISPSSEVPNVFASLHSETLLRKVPAKRQPLEFAWTLPSYGGLPAYNNVTCHGER